MSAIYRVGGSFGLLSVFGSFLILLTFALIRSIRRHPHNLIFFLALSDFLFSFKYFASSLFPNSSDLLTKEPVCITQAVFSQFFGLCSISWIGMISINLIFTLRNPFGNTEKYSLFYHSWVWSYAAVTTVAMVFINSHSDNPIIGDSGDGTCWIAKDPNFQSLNWFQLTFFIPLAVYFLMAVVALFYATMRTKQTNALIRAKTPDEREKKANERLLMRMRFFVVIFMLFWLGPILDRVFQFWNIENVILKYWDIIGTSGQGFANACVWLSNPSLFKGFKEKILKRVLRLFCCCPNLHETTLPLFSSIADELEDTQQDIQQVDIILRKNIIRALLLGIRKSVQASIAHNSDEIYDSMDLFRSNKELFNTTTTYSNIFPKSEFDKINNNKQQQLNFESNDWVFTDFSAVLFEELRQLNGISAAAYQHCLHPDRFLASLDTQKFSEGKSGSFFCFSPDKNFIMKTIPESEAIVLRKILPDYYHHLSANPSSFIIRLYGLHSLKIQNDVEIFVVVMGNVFNTDKKIHERYDLKGSWVKRSVRQHAKNPSNVLGKDMDLKRKLNVPVEKRKEVLQQLVNDVRFLRRIKIMDYSLLLGFHFLENSTPTNNNDGSIQDTPEESAQNSDSVNVDVEHLSEHEQALKYLKTDGILSADGSEMYFIGIIDILQKYDCNKKTERCFKVYCLHADKDGLSVQPDDIYCDRFIAKLERLIYSLD